MKHIYVCDYNVAKVYNVEDDRYDDRYTHTHSQ
jgi:hypothetical protein